MRLLNALNSEDRGLKVRFSLAMIVSETFELILCQMLSSQGKKRTFRPLSSLFSAFSNLRETGPVQLNRALFAYQKRFLASSFLLLGSEPDGLGPILVAPSTG